MIVGISLFIRRFTNNWFSGSCVIPENLHFEKLQHIKLSKFFLSKEEKNCQIKDNPKFRITPVNL